MLAPKVTKQISCMNSGLVGRKNNVAAHPYELPSLLYPLCYSAPPILVRCWSIWLPLSHLFSLPDKHFLICLAKAQISLGPPHHTPELNQTVYQILFVMCFPLIALRLDLGATDFVRCSTHIAIHILLKLHHMIQRFS